MTAPIVPKVNFIQSCWRLSDATDSVGSAGDRHWFGVAADELSQRTSEKAIAKLWTHLQESGEIIDAKPDGVTTEARRWFPKDAAYAALDKGGRNCGQVRLNSPDSRRMSGTIDRMTPRKRWRRPGHLRLVSDTLKSVAW